MKKAKKTLFGEREKGSVWYWIGMIIFLAFISALVKLIVKW